MSDDIRLAIPVWPDGCKRIGVSRTGGYRLIWQEKWRTFIMPGRGKGGRRMTTPKACEDLIADLEREAQGEQ